MHTQTSNLVEHKQADDAPPTCGFCGAAALIPIDERPHDYFCDPTKSGCARLTRPAPTDEKERAEFDRWCGETREAAKFQWGFDVDTRGRERIEVYDDAVYLVRRNQDGGRLMFPVLAMPFALERIVIIEGEERLDVRAPGQISGTHDEVARELRRTGRFLEPRQGERILSLLAHEYRRSRTVDQGRETFEIYDDQDYDRLQLPLVCYPQPGTQAEEFKQLEQILQFSPTPGTWEAFLRFEGHYHPHETAPVKAACAVAPLARLLRSRRYIVASPYLISTNSGAGKTTVAEAYSNTAWNQKERQSDDLNSDFRFAEYLSSSATPMAVNEAEKFDWQRYGANVKASLESENVTTRGTKELRMKKFPSRRIPIWTSNQLPALARPTLVRMKVVRFNEERARLGRDAQEAFSHDLEALGPVGPALARAWLERFRTLGELLEAIEERAKEILDVHGPFDDLRRARSWAIDHLALETWQEASGGIHVAPAVFEFVDQVVRPVELDTFAFRADRLGMLRAWFDRWRVERRRHDAAGEPYTQGDGEIFAEHAWTPPESTEPRVGWLVTAALLQAYNQQARSPGERIETLVELARLVAEAYELPVEALTEGRQVPRWQFGGTRRRAAWVPTDEKEDWQNAK